MAGGTINLAVKTTNDSSGLKAAATDLENFGKAAKTSGDDVDAGAAKAAKAAKQLETDIAKASAVGVLGIAALGIGAVAMAGQYESAMSQVAAVSGATGAELTQLKALGKDIGAETAFSARDAAGAMEELAAGGRSVAQIMGGEARAAVDLAAAGNYGLADSGRTIATVMDVWKNTQISTNDVVDRLAGAANASRFGVDDMSQAVAQAGGVAAQMGVSFEDFTTAIAMSASSFASGSDAGTSYKTMLLNLDGSTDKAKAKLDELGLSFRDQSGHIKSTHDIAQELADKVGILGEAEQTAALKVIFGNDAYRTAAAMMDGAGEAATRVNDVLSNTNAADVAATRMDNAKGAFEEFKGAAETLAISIGEKALPAMTDMAGAGVAMLNGFGGLPESTQGLALGMTAVAIAMPAAVAGVEKMVGAMRAMRAMSGAGALGPMLGTAALGIGAVTIALDAFLAKTTGEGLVVRILGKDDEIRGMGQFNEELARTMAIMKGAGVEIDAAAEATKQWNKEWDEWDSGNKGYDNLGKLEGATKAYGQAMVDAGATAGDLKAAYDALPIEATKQWFDESTGALEKYNMQLLDTSTKAWVASEAFMNGVSPAVRDLVEQTPVAKSALEDFTAGLSDGAKWADELGSRLDTLAGRFGSLDPQMAINNINLAILKEELADVTAAGGDFSERLGMTTGQMEAQIAVLDGSNAALGSNEDAYRTLMGEMEKLAGPAGTVSGAVLNIDAAIRATNLSSEDQIEVAGQVGQAMSALATGDIPAVVGALLTIGETSPLAMQAFVDGIKDPAKKEAIIAHIETIAPAVGATLRPAMAKVGEEGGAAMAEGVTSQEGAATTAGDGLGVAVVGGIGGQHDNVYSAGVGLGAAAAEGMESGILNNMFKGINAAARMAADAIAAAKGPQGLDINSPSKKFIELGKSAAEGFALGMKESEAMVADAGGHMVLAGLAGGGNNIPAIGGGAAAGITAPGIAPAKPAGKLPLIDVSPNKDGSVFWDPNTGTFVNGTTNMPGTSATWNPATGELGTDAIQANGGLTVYQGSDGKWRRVVTDELATNPDGTWKTDRDRLDAIAYQSRSQAGDPALHTGGEHGIADGIAGSTMGVTGAYASGYLGFMMADAIKYRMRPNELGHGALSDRFYNYGQDMSDSNFGKKTYGPEDALAPGIDPWHPNAMLGGMSRYWETDTGSTAGGSWKTAGRRQVADSPKQIVVNVQAMDSQSFLRAAPQIREALRLDSKRGY